MCGGQAYIDYRLEWGYLTRPANPRPTRHATPKKQKRRFRSAYPEIAMKPSSKIAGRYIAATVMPHHPSALSYFDAPVRFLPNAAASREVVL